MAFLGFGSSNPTIDIKIEGIESRKHSIIKEKNAEPRRLPVFTGDDDLSGTIEIKLNKTKKFEHTGIRIDLIGHVEVLNDKT